MEKILLIHTKYQNFGGEDQSIINEIELLKKNYNVEILINTNKITNLFNDFFTILLNRNYSFEKKLKNKLREYKPDYIYVHNTWFKTSLGIFKILDQYKKPVLLKLHNFRYHCTAHYLHRNHLEGREICEACGIENNSKTLSFARYGIQSELVKNNFGIFEPKDKEFVDIEDIDIVLIPCVAFNDKLFRLGMGGGFYDRTFSKKSSTILIGIAYSFQNENEPFQEKHDIKMDYVITQKGVLK